MTHDLIPCPLCGSTDLDERWGYDCVWYEVTCFSCGAHAESDMHVSGIEPDLGNQAACRWNDREIERTPGPWQWRACKGVGSDTVARYRSSIGYFAFWHDDTPIANDLRETVAFHRRGDPLCTAHEATP